MATQAAALAARKRALKAKEAKGDKEEPTFVTNGWVENITQEEETLDKYFYGDERSEPHIHLSNQEKLKQIIKNIISNYEENDLIFEKLFTDNQSAWDIYLYKLL